MWCLGCLWVPWQVAWSRRTGGWADLLRTRPSSSAVRTTSPPHCSLRLNGRFCVRVRVSKFSRTLFLHDPPSFNEPTMTSKGKNSRGAAGSRQIDRDLVERKRIEEQRRRVIPDFVFSASLISSYLVLVLKRGLATGRPINVLDFIHRVDGR